MRTSSPTSLSRRHFLALSGATAAVPSLWVPRRRGPNAKVQIGIVGMGIRGRNLLRSEFFPNDGFHVVAVCDVDTTRREHAKSMVDERQGTQDCLVFDDHRDLMQHPDVDAVVIATPDHWHAIQVLDACLAGKDVYCEKPLTRTLHEAKTLIDAVRKTGIVFQTGSQQRTEFGHRFVSSSRNAARRCG